MDRRHVGERLSVAAATRRLQTLTMTEALYEAQPDYMGKVQLDGMCDTWREKIVTWFQQLGESFRLSQVTLSVAVNYLDRFLSVKSVDSVNFQLASITAIFVASKVEEPRPFRTSEFVRLSDGIFSASDIRLMELELLCTLNWHLNPPTAIEFVNLFLVFIENESLEHKVHDTAIHFAKLSRTSTNFLMYPPSMIAVASVICALKHLDVPMAEVEQWMRRVQACKLSYTDRDDAAQAITECGLKFIALSPFVGPLKFIALSPFIGPRSCHGLVRPAFDEEVEEAKSLFDDEAAAAEIEEANASPSDKGTVVVATPEERNSKSPSDVMDI